MKIAIDIRTAGGEKAGKGWYTFHIVRNLLKLDIDNEYILYVKDQVPGFDQFDNAIIKQIKGNGYFWHRKVAKDALNEEVDIFFAPSSYIIPAILPKRIKTIITVHDLVAFLFPSTHNKKATILERMFLKKALKKAQYVLTVSNNTKNDLTERFNFDKDKIKITYCSASEQFQPIEKDSLESFIKKTKLPPKFFISVGTLIPRKNYLNLIRAFSIFQNKFNDFNLIIAGGKGWGYKETLNTIEKNHLKSKVHILGYISRNSLINLYNLATGLVFPSYYEGFGIPPLEAMKCGCPVIASYTSSIPEVVGDAALLVNPESPTDIAEAMIKLVTNKDLNMELKNKGFIQSKKFNWENSANIILQIINNL